MSEQISGGAMDLSHLVNARAGAPASAPGAASPPPGGQTVDVPSLVLNVTDQTFEQTAQLSSVVPVVVHLWSAAGASSDELTPLLEKLTHEFAGRILLAHVDIDTNAGIAQAFQAQSVPTVVAMVGGRPLPLFQGQAPEAQVRDLYNQLVQLAEQQGITGRVNAPAPGEGAPDETAETEAPPNPAHAEALEALERGDYAASVSAYERVLMQSPADSEARAALVQVKLLHRLEGRAAEDIRQAAGENPTDIEAQLRVADLDVSGGHVEDAFLRILDLFASSQDENERTALREHLVELFEVVGPTDSRVMSARTRLANLLY